MELSSQVRVLMGCPQLHDNLSIKYNEVTKKSRTKQPTKEEYGQCYKGRYLDYEGYHELTSQIDSHSPTHEPLSRNFEPFPYSTSDDYDQNFDSTSSQWSRDADSNSEVEEIPGNFSYINEYTVENMEAALYYIENDRYIFSFRDRRIEIHKEKSVIDFFKQIEEDFDISNVVSNGIVQMFLYRNENLIPISVSIDRIFSNWDEEYELHAVREKEKVSLRIPLMYQDEEIDDSKVMTRKPDFHGIES